MMRHALRTLLAPASVALVGASERAGALGRVLFENIRNDRYKGRLHAVNPESGAVHRIYATLFPRSLTAISETVGPPAIIGTRRRTQWYCSA